MHRKSMATPRRYLTALLILALAQSSCLLISQVSKTPGRDSQLATTGGYGSLDNYPFREAWYGMYFKEDKVGYSHFKIQPVGGNFKISSDSMLRLTALKKTNEIRMKEKVMVRPDLTLVSFESLVRMNDKDLRMNGRVEGGRLLARSAAEGEKINRDFPIKADLYHSSAISLMPAMKGLKDGHSYSFAIFNAEKQGMEKVEQHVSKVAGGPGPGSAVWKVKNNYGRSVVHSWLDGKGLVVLEKALEGSLITMLEDEASASSFQKKTTSGKDLVLDFSLIRVAKPIPSPAKVRFLKIAVEGIDASAFPDDHRQKVSRGQERTAPNTFEVTVRAEDPATIVGKDQPLPGPSAKENLASTLTVQSDHKEVVAQAEKIVSRGTRTSTR